MLLIGVIDAQLTGAVVANIRYGGIQIAAAGVYKEFFDLRGVMSRFDSMVHAIMPVLIDAAKKRSTVSFAILYRIVDLTRDDERHECHRALEEAADLIRDFRIANYTCLMARKDSGLPGDGFFDMFRLHRNEEYINLVGNVWITDLTREQRQKLTHAERARVYADAK